MSRRNYYPNSPQGIGPVRHDPQAIGPDRPKRYDDAANRERNRESTSERWRREQHDRRSDIKPNTKIFNDGKGGGA